ncbi:MAG TPA: hypothetical protein VIG33_06125 [Pseudobdellovibrionaceae bacterium]
MKRSDTSQWNFGGWVFALTLQEFLFWGVLTNGYPSFLGHQFVGGGIKGLAFPDTAADFIEKNQVTGNIFNETDWGSYLAWRWHGERKVFYHGHIDDPAFLKNEYMKVYRSPAEFEDLVQKNDIKIFLMRTMRFTPGYRLTIKNLVDGMARGEWKLIYSDPNASILIKTSIK